MTGKKLLIISAYPFNNKTAGQTNTNTVINDLHEAGSEMDAICFSFPGHETENSSRFRHLITIGRNRPQSFLYSILFFFLFPLYTKRLSLRAIFYILKNQHSYNYIFLDYAQVFIYSLFISNKSKIIFNVHDVNLQKYHRMYRSKPFLSFIKNYLIFSEALFFKKAKHITVLSLKDKRLVKHFYKKDAVAVLPKNNFLKNSSCNKVTAGLNQFLFIGAWNRPENVQGLDWFLQHVYPLLNKNYSFVIAGSNLPGYIKQRLPSNFSAAGFVEDLDNLIRQSSAVISPLFQGAGIKFKVLDALSNGCRVIGTPIAFEGIDVKIPGACFTGRTPADFADAINFCSNHTPDCEIILKEFRSFLDKYETVSNLIAEDYFKT